MRTPSDPRVSLWRQATATLQDVQGTQARPSHEEIAALAYARYISRTDANGSPAVDWLEAERELTSQVSRVGTREHL
jgi:Protein of unknown function (DUF2934)